MGASKKPLYTDQDLESAPDLEEPFEPFDIVEQEWEGRHAAIEDRILDPDDDFGTVLERKKRRGSNGR